jgi:hypothetical protein
MAGVFRECKVSWKGESHTFTPSMRLLRLIERGDGSGPVSIVSIMSDANNERPQVSFMAWLVHMVMTYAGADCDEAEIYAGMMGREDEAIALYRGVIEALSPSEKKEKKAVAPDE